MPWVASVTLIGQFVEWDKQGHKMQIGQTQAPNLNSHFKPSFPQTVRSQATWNLTLPSFWLCFANPKNPDGWNLPDQTRLLAPPSISSYRPAKSWVCRFQFSSPLVRSLETSCVYCVMPVNCSPAWGHVNDVRNNEAHLGNLEPNCGREERSL